MLSRHPNKMSMMACDRTTHNQDCVMFSRHPNKMSMMAL